MKTIWLAGAAVALAAAWPGGVRAGTAAEPLEAGERQLTSAEKDARLAALAERFKTHPAVAARIVTEVEDLVGTRTEEGELVLDRPTRLMRKFTKPSLKIWLLADAKISEYVAKTKTVYVKDFSKAPKALELLQAALMVDFKRLEQTFDIQVFEGPAGLRLLCTKKAGTDQPLLYRRIQARIAPDGICFSELLYLPDEGERTVEKYSDIRPLAEVHDEAFALDLPADVTRKVMVLTDKETK